MSDTEIVKSGSVMIDDIQADYIIRKDNTVRRTRYYTVLKNPFVESYYTKVLYASKIEILERKLGLWLRYWKQEKDKGTYEKREHEVQKQSTGEEDSLPFY